MGVVVVMFTGASYENEGPRQMRGRLERALCGATAGRAEILQTPIEQYDSLVYSRRITAKIWGKGIEGKGADGAKLEKYRGRGIHGETEDGGREMETGGKVDIDIYIYT